MGRPIVYCEACGNSLREEDFDRRRASMIENRPFCAECRPFQDAEAAPRRTSSGKIPASPPRKTSTGHIPILAPPSRRPRPEGPGFPLALVAAGGAAVLLMVYAFTQGESRRAPIAEAPPAPAPAPIQIPFTPAPADPAPLREPPPPPRKLPLPAAPPSPPGMLVVPTAAEKFDAFLVQIRQMIQTDADHERTDEVLGMFTAALQTAGSRVAEVEKMKAEYLSGLDEPARRAAAWSDWKITTSTAPGHSGLLASYADRSGVYMTHPLDATTPARLERELSLPTGKKCVFTFSVNVASPNSFELRLLADGKPLLREIVGAQSQGWRDKSVDLSAFAGRRIMLRLEQAPHDGCWESAYWSDLNLIAEDR